MAAVHALQESMYHLCSVSISLLACSLPLYQLQLLPIRVCSVQPEQTNDITQTLCLAAFSVAIALRYEATAPRCVCFDDAISYSTKRLRGVIYFDCFGRCRY